MSHQDLGGPPKQVRDLGHEPEGSNARAVGLFAGGLLVTLVLIDIVLRLSIQAAAHHPTPGRHVPVPPTPQNLGITEWVAPQEILQQLRGQQESRIAGYGWVDRQRGIARIPIGLAMDLASRGMRAVPDSLPGETDDTVLPGEGAGPADMPPAMPEGLSREKPLNPTVKKDTP